MDFERQKPVTDAYRENFDKIFPPNGGLAQMPRFRNDWHVTYPNDCPILPSDPQKDDF
jgi:hypothetical protein